LEVAGLGGCVIAGAVDGEGDDRQVSTAIHSCRSCGFFVACMLSCGMLSGRLRAT
jgi:hypothetical protein